MRFGLGIAAGSMLIGFSLAVLACSSGRGASAGAASQAETSVEVPIATSTEVIAAATPSAVPTPVGPLAGRRICLDPGHDAYWVVGASGRTSGGTVPIHPADKVPLFEHELTLSVAYRLKALLEADGAEVCVTRKPRDLGGGLQAEPYDYTGDGRVRTAAYVEDGPERIQPRIDWANQFGAEVLVSIHFNGLDDGRVRGTEVYFTDAGPKKDDARRLASGLLSGLLAEMKVAGFAATDRGIRSDAYQRYSADETRRMITNNAGTIRANGADPNNCADCYRLLTLGNNPMSLHRSTYVGALVEAEFLSNPAVVEGFIMRPDSLDITARGLLQGIRAYFARD